MQTQSQQELVKRAKLVRTEFLSLCDVILALKKEHGLTNTMIARYLNCTPAHIGQVTLLALLNNQAKECILSNLITAPKAIKILTENKVNPNEIIIAASAIAQKMGEQVSEKHVNLATNQITGHKKRYMNKEPIRIYQVISFIERDRKTELVTECYDDAVECYDELVANSSVSNTALIVWYDGQAEVKKQSIKGMD